MIVRMWEATVSPGRLDDAIEWVRRDLVPRALLAHGCLAAEILIHEGTPESIVLVTRWDVAPVFEEGWPDDEVLTRARAQHLQTLRTDIS
jgi:quinol monooxygenase YgiN